MNLDKLDSRISKTDWEATPEGVKGVVVELAERVEQLQQRVKLLSSQMTPLVEQIDKIETKLARRKSMKRKRNRGFG
ncbi:hypothetical protein S7335_1187 [Synechococcus sp. PCC 7335]|uniref:hypothetical protein n=1 Tax=Synechococcus sp. (strain ATCC 29403 / PCC 7335) TaxID=91464 RepID=UPI00017EB919|nr:hypothetical protein [Synechococcus sp. PCC 7335]EDX82483.1 hypothetical protein S7335_1187 [Synechococcus sp. PCC 7335]